MTGGVTILKLSLLLSFRKQITRTNEINENKKCLSNTLEVVVGFFCYV